MKENGSTIGHGRTCTRVHILKVIREGAANGDAACSWQHVYLWAAGADFGRSDMRHLTVTAGLVGSIARVRTVAILLSAHVRR